MKEHHNKIDKNEFEGRSRGNSFSSPRWESSYTITSLSSGSLDQLVNKSNQFPGQTHRSQKKTFKNIFKRIKSNQLEKLKEISHTPAVKSSGIPSIDDKNDNKSERSFQEKKGTKMGTSRHFPSVLKLQNTLREQKYLKKIQELQTQLSRQSNVNEEDELILIQMQNKKQRRIIEELHKERQQLLQKVSEFHKKILNLSQELDALQKCLEHEKKQNTKFQEQLMNEKDNCLNLQIQYQKDMFELEFLRKQKQCISTSPELIKKYEETIRQLKQNLEFKQKQNQIIINQLQSFKSERLKIQQRQQKSQYWPQNYNKNKMQISRSDIEFKNRSCGAAKNENQQLKQKIASLQKTLNEERVHKIHQAQLIKGLQNQYEQKIKQNSFLKKELRKSCKNEEQRILNFQNRGKLSFPLNDQEKKKQMEWEKKIKLKQEQLYLQLQKITGFHRISLNDMQKKLNLKIEMAQRDTNYWKKESFYWKDQCYSLKDIIIAKLTQKNIYFESIRNQYQQKVKRNLGYGSSNHSPLRNESKQPQRQIDQFLNKLQTLSNSYDKSLIQNSKCQFLQKQNEALKARLKEVECLWKTSKK